MPELNQLQQLLCIAKYGNLSNAAEELHLSQPAISRSMQKLENELQITLFERSKNKITFNQTGELAVEYAQKVIGQVDDMIFRLRSFDRSQRTIAIGSCAPGPLWDMIPMLSSLYPDMTISSETRENDQLLQGLTDRIYQLIITPFPINEPNIYCVKYGEEHLMFSLPLGHALSSAKGLHFEDLNGETVLLFSQIGFWHDIHKEKMPSTHFLLQSEQFAFTELVKASALPSFTSDLALKKAGTPDNRVIVPILDDEACATYYCSCSLNNKKRFAPFWQQVKLE